MVTPVGAEQAIERLDDVGLAAVFSAEVSAADAVLFMLSTSLTQALYKRFVNPAASDRQVLTIARGAARVAPPLDGAVAPRPDVRRWIYGGLDLLFAGAYALVIWKVIPNRLPSASFHLWTSKLPRRLASISTARSVGP